MDDFAFWTPVTQLFIQAMPQQTKSERARNAWPSEVTEKPPAIIAIMGSTGVGKTSFINQVTGHSLPVGHELDSCTKEVREVQLKRGKRNVVLVDTPGFGDSSMSDTEVLSLIAKYLVTSFKAGTKLTGIIFMHRISDSKVKGSTRRNFKMFHQLCGSDHLRQVAIVTTWWDKVDIMTAQSRENQLMTGQTLFKPMLDHDASMMRHDGSRACAKDIVDHFLRLERMVLKIQRQLIMDKMSLFDVDAGLVINTDLANDIRRCVERLAAVKDELKGDQDRKTKSLLEEERKELEAERKALHGQLRTISKGLNERTHLWRLICL